MYSTFIPSPPRSPPTYSIVRATLHCPEYNYSVLLQKTLGWLESKEENTLNMYWKESIQNIKVDNFIFVLTVYLFKDLVWKWFAVHSIIFYTFWRYVLMVMIETRRIKRWLVLHILHLECYMGLEYWRRKRRISGRSCPPQKDLGFLDYGLNWNIYIWNMMIDISAHLSPLLNHVSFASDKRWR